MGGEGGGQTVLGRFFLIFQVGVKIIPLPAYVQRQAYLFLSHVAGTIIFPVG